MPKKTKNDGLSPVVLPCINDQGRWHDQAVKTAHFYRNLIGNVWRSGWVDADLIGKQHDPLVAGTLLDQATLSASDVRTLLNRLPGFHGSDTVWFDYMDQHGRVLPNRLDDFKQAFCQAWLFRLLWRQSDAPACLDGISMAITCEGADDFDSSSQTYPPHLKAPLKHLLNAFCTQNNYMGRFGFLALACSLSGKQLKHKAIPQTRRVHVQIKSGAIVIDDVSDHCVATPGVDVHLRALGVTKKGDLSLRTRCQVDVHSWRMVTTVPKAVVDAFPMDWNDSKHQKAMEALCMVGPRGHQTVDRAHKLDLHNQLLALHDDVFAKTVMDQVEDTLSCKDMVSVPLPTHIDHEPGHWLAWVEAQPWQTIHHQSQDLQRASDSIGMHLREDLYQTYGQSCKVMHDLWGASDDALCTLIAQSVARTTVEAELATKLNNIDDKAVRAWVQQNSLWMLDQLYMQSDQPQPSLKAVYLASMMRRYLLLALKRGREHLDKLSLCTLLHAAWYGLSQRAFHAGRATLMRGQYHNAAMALALNQHNLGLEPVSASRQAQHEQREAYYYSANKQQVKAAANLLVTQPNPRTHCVVWQATAEGQLERFCIATSTNLGKPQDYTMASKMICGDRGLSQRVVESKPQKVGDPAQRLALALATLTSDARIHVGMVADVALVDLSERIMQIQSALEVAQQRYGDLALEQLNWSEIEGDAKVYFPQNPTTQGEYIDCVAAQHVRQILTERAGIRPRRTAFFDQLSTGGAQKDITCAFDQSSCYFTHPMFLQPALAVPALGQLLHRAIRQSAMAVDVAVQQLQSSDGFNPTITLQVTDEDGVLHRLAVCLHGQLRHGILQVKSMEFKAMDPMPHHADAWVACARVIEQFLLLSYQDQACTQGTMPHAFASKIDGQDLSWWDTLNLQQSADGSRAFQGEPSCSPFPQRIVATRSAQSSATPKG